MAEVRARAGTGFVVVSGLPASGKTTLARALASSLELPLIDKDEILDRLFEERGVGDAAWRRSLSRESDTILRRRVEAAASGAVVSSFWRLPGMPDDTGTPIDWLTDLARPLVVVHCACPPETAARRFLERRRHPGHLDAEADPEALLTRFRDLARLGALDVATRLDVDTTRAADVNRLATRLRAALAGPPV